MSLHLFNFREGIAPNYISALPVAFTITPACSYDILVMRMLTCNIDIYSLKQNKFIRLDTNYTSFPSHRVSRKSTRQIRNLLLPNTINDYVRFSAKYYSRNVIFYHNLLQELTFYFYYSNQNQFQAAFVNLYRILEYVSYTFPLMHSSHFGNYLGSFEAFRSYFTDAKTSEINFFDKFITRLFRGTAYLGITSDFNFSNVDVIIADNCYDALHSLMRPADWIVADRANHNLSIENKNMIKLFKNTRNKYFHFAVGGQRNLQNTDLKDPDFFFQCINAKYLNWISFIYANVVKESLDNAL
jgi:hypothetical protein